MDELLALSPVELMVGQMVVREAERMDEPLDVLWVDELAMQLVECWVVMMD